jgi:hypothetical protein
LPWKRATARLKEIDGNKILDILLPHFTHWGCYIILMDVLGGYTSGFAWLVLSIVIGNTMKQMVGTKA